MVFFRAFVILAAMCAAMASGATAGVVVETAGNASAVERLAAGELQRYLYLRTGVLPTIGVSSGASTRIVVVRKDRAQAKALGKAAKALGPQQYILKTTTSRGARTYWIVGGDDTGTLYGAYRFAEKLGVRFYLHGDVVPDERLAKLPDVNETGKPIFSIRGIQPFHDFPEGPDWWNTGDYLAYISQLAKMGMNFVGLHCYPENAPVCEPAVWIGLAQDADAKGRVSQSYPSQWANTERKGMWGYDAMPTSEFCAGASMLFANDSYGPEVMNGVMPAPESPEQCNELFNRTGGMLRTAFAYARDIGVKTCVGTETPLTIPGPVKERLTKLGKDPADPAVVQELYEGMFRRISNAYPVDYYWLWTPEGWTWGGNSEEDMKATMADIQAALGALDTLGKPFTLATCGWVLGPVQDRAALDKVLPKSSPMSCINRSVGHAPVEPSFAAVRGRPKWAIPWMENDPALTSPQPWVGRMRYDAVDAKKLGCTGLLGIHWRTKQMAMNVAALADAGWDQSWIPASVAAKPRKIDGPTGGKVVTFTAPVDDTEDDVVYQSVRYDVDGYRLKVPNGTYTLTLKFNEPHYGDAGKRVFGVELQGSKVIESLDVFARVGKNKALDFTYPNVRVTDGAVSIRFARQVEYPFIAGIVIEGKTDAGKPFTRKVNCGGNAYAGYEADTSATGEELDRRAMPVEDFYIDFARAEFGAGVAKEAGAILAKIDGRGLPESSAWLVGPGGLPANPAPLADVRARYAFVDKLVALRRKVNGAGNLARFDYWLNTYKYMATMAKLGCMRGELDRKMAAVAAAGDPKKQGLLAEEALVVRTHMARLWEWMLGYQLQTADTPGEMGTIANLEQHSRKQLKFLSGHDEALAKALGRALPKEVEPSGAYKMAARVTVPTVRTQVRKGEALGLDVIVLDKDAPKSAALLWREMGKGEYREIPLEHVGRGVYSAKLPPAQGSFEYHIAVETASGSKLVWPASAPKIDQTVVVW